MGRAGFLLAAALLLLALAFGLRGQLVGLPEVPAAAAAGGFDTGRAMARLQRILGDEAPHPVDSDANDAVRARLIAELEAIGLAPRVTDDFVCNPFPRQRFTACARIRNVVATIGPEEAAGHVMMVSHYDSTPVGPGAGDAGIGVAVMLEAAALLRDRPPARPVSFLFNEGEEAGLIGARAFLERDPLAERVESIVNLEARGVTGPALMFETSMPNGAAIGHFARTSERPVANSLSTDFYKMLPNSTDVAVLEERPYTILNFAIAGNETRYHTAGDDFAALDPRSVAHMGAQALAAVEDMASGHDPGMSGRVIYADLAGRQLLVLPLAVGAVLLLAFLAFFAWRSRRAGGFLAVLAIWAAASLASAALAFLLQWLVGTARGVEYHRAWPELTAGAVYALALAAGLAALARIGAARGISSLRAGYWLLFLLLGGAISVAMPGALIFFLLPPIAAAAGMIIERWMPGAERTGAIVAVLILLLTWLPLLHFLEVAMGVGRAWAYAPLALTVMLPALIELKPLLAETRPRPLFVGVAAAAVMLWAAVAAVPAYSQDRMRALGFEYVWDADAGEGRWTLFGDAARPPRAVQALGPFEPGYEVPHSLRRRRAAPAPAIPTEAPSAELVAERRQGEARRLALRVRSEGAEVVQLRIPPAAGPLAARINGRPVRFEEEGDSERDHVLRCHGRSCAEMRVELLLASDEPVEIGLVGIRSGLPPAGRALIEARPADARPQYAPDSTVAFRKMTF